MNPNEILSKINNTAIADDIQNVSLDLLQDKSCRENINLSLKSISNIEYLYNSVQNYSRYNNKKEFLVEYCKNNINFIPLNMQTIIFLFNSLKSGNVAVIKELVKKIDYSQCKNENLSRYLLILFIWLRMFKEAENIVEQQHFYSSVNISNDFWEIILKRSTGEFDIAENLLFQHIKRNDYTEDNTRELASLYYVKGYFEKSIYYRKKSLEFKSVYFIHNLTQLAITYRSNGEWEKCLSEHQDNFQKNDIKTSVIPHIDILEYARTLRYIGEKKESLNILNKSEHRVCRLYKSLITHDMNFTLQENSCRSWYIYYSLYDFWSNVYNTRVLQNKKNKIVIPDLLSDLLKKNLVEKEVINKELKLFNLTS